MIYHITSRTAWRQAQARGSYTTASLASQGFIHFSKLDQITATANRFYHGHNDLVLLAVDPALLQAKLRYEEGEPGILFPHLYGPLNLDAVSAVYDFPPASDGSFPLPVGLSSPPD